ncbi:MAG: molybdopterin-binding protein [candidate division KSB1 bacterium]|nr:molybdopterin-binding protein [candidate division KSB1 bacterium]MDQ7065002.1 molybdopterin-binding protein [candidate division KSB1 bacterium]
MKFLRIPIENAVGAISAHNLYHPQGKRILAKGDTIAPQHLDTLREAGHETVFVAQLEPGDLHEDEAAARLATLLKGDRLYFKRPATGRANLRAECPGVLRVNVDALLQINAIGHGISLATLVQHSFVQKDQLVATVKIIRFGLEQHALGDIENRLAAGAPALQIEPLKLQRIGLIVSSNHPDHDSIARRFRPGLEYRARVYHFTLAEPKYCRHEPDDIAAAIRAQKAAGMQCVFIVGMSAIIDPEDVVPQAVKQAGADNVHYGFPVDPGNLTLLAYVDDMPIVGIPGCARSKRRNAIDLILPRVLTGERIGREAILELGHGGLLEEIKARPLPRDAIDR